MQPSPTPSEEQIQEAIRSARLRTKTFTRRLPSWIDKENLEGEALLAVAKAIHDFDPAHGSKFLSYCAMKVKYALLSEAERQNHHGFTWLPPSLRNSTMRPALLDQPLTDRDGEELELHFFDPAASPLDQVKLDFLRADLETALAELDLVHPRYRRVLHHRFLEGLSHLETAQRLGLGESSVWFDQRRALDYLRAHHPDLAEYLVADPAV